MNMPLTLFAIVLLASKTVCDVVANDCIIAGVYVFYAAAWPFYSFNILLFIVMSCCRRFWGRFCIMYPRVAVVPFFTAIVDADFIISQPTMIHFINKVNKSVFVKVSWINKWYTANDLVKISWPNKKLTYDTALHNKW